MKKYAEFFRTALTEYWLILLLLLIVIVFTFSVLTQYFASFGYPLPNNSTKWGEFGDYLGGILNPLIALCALCALLVSIKMQFKEIRSATALLEKSNEKIDQQNFENSFFSMLEMHQNIIKNLEHHTLFHEDGTELRNPVIKKGLSAMQEYQYELIENLSIYLGHRYASNNYLYDNFRIDELNKATDNYLLTAADNILPFVKSFVAILLRIDSSDIVDKSMYYKLLFAGLTGPSWFILMVVLSNKEFEDACKIFYGKNLIQESTLKNNILYKQILDVIVSNNKFH